MKYLLHIDTATDTGAVALAGDGKILSLRTNTESRNHAGTINIMIGEVLAEANCNMQQIDAVAVCGGPGSYTGLRIGMSTAKGMCYALDKPLIMADRLSLLTYSAWLNNKNAYDYYVALLRARDKEYFIAAYDAGFGNTIPPHHIIQDELSALIQKAGKTYIITDEQDGVFKEFTPDQIKIDNIITVDYNSWALYAFDQFQCNKTVNLATAEPFYLKQVYTHK